MKSSFQTWFKRTGVVLSVSTFSMAAAMAQAADTIKVGVLHSLSGTMAISETTLKDTVLMMIEDQNAKGGLLGKNSKPLWLTPPLTGLYLLKKPSNY